ncbi:MAG: hypothetical protein IT423_18355 [Pirellulaceae bacterium]|nr:hypothetical protein [Pirellulaceae bacterium]
MANDPNHLPNSSEKSDTQASSSADSNSAGNAMASETSASVGQNNSDGVEKLAEPSMGPACLVISVLALAMFSAFCGIGSFFAFSNQPALAERGITQMLMPWVETSNLSPGYKREIMADLQDTVEKVKSRTLTSRQLSRLKSALEDNPVLLWGNVEGVLAQAESAGLSQVEIDAANRISQRLLHAAAMRKLGRNDLVYTLEGCTHTRKDGEGLEVNTSLTAQQIQEFLGRAERFINGNGVPNEPFEKTVPEVFRGLIDDALTVK